MIRLFYVFIICLFALPGWSATTYLDASATESGCTGTSADPCKELDHIEDDSHSSGDKVLLKCGETWSKSAGDWGSIDAQGVKVEGDTNLTVGAYYLDGATPREVDGVTYKCTDAAAGPSVNPIIDGNQDTASCDDINPKWAGIRVAGGTTGMVIKDIKITRTEWGIGVRQAATSSAAISNITITRVQIDDVCDDGILIQPNPVGDDDVSNVTVSYSTLTNLQMSFSGGVAGWGQGLTSRSADNITFNNNILGQSHGEGIHVGFGAEGGSIYENIVYDTSSVGIYISTAHDFNVYRNWVIHTDESWDTGGGRPNMGVGFGSENDLLGEVESSGVKIHNNVVIGYDACYGHTDNFDDSDGTADGGYGENYVYNNTFIDCSFNYRIEDGVGTAAELTVTFQNNLSVINHNAASSHVQRNTVATGFTFSGNGWDSSEVVGLDDGAYCTSGNCTSGGDVTGDPDLVDPAACNASGWRSCEPYTEPDWGDAAHGADSDFLNNASDLGAEYDDGLDPSSEWPISVVPADQDAYGAGWEFGAYVYESSAEIIRKFKGAGGGRMGAQ